MEATVQMHSPWRQVTAASVVIALALAIYGCGPSLERGKVLFSTDKPTANGTCTPEHMVTSVGVGTSVYATYVYKARPGDETVSLEVTKDGESFGLTMDMDTSWTKGLDCFGDTSDLSTLDGWGVGAYTFTLTALGDTVAEGTLTVTD
jgi:hypothetical protein